MATTISDDLLQCLAPVREVGAHKGSAGGVLIIAGSPQYPGAAVLAARSAGRNGAGIVYLATPRSVISTVASAIPEVAFVPLPETTSGPEALSAMERIEEKQGRIDAVVLGPGLGDDDSTDRLLRALFGFGHTGSSHTTGFGFGAEQVSAAEPVSLFSIFDGNVVVDADALNWLARQQKWWENVPAYRLVLTPHPGEASRLAELPIDEITADPTAIATQLADRWSQTVVIKSGNTAVSNGTETRVADLAPTSLATAGSGDCFAGATGAFLAQGKQPVDAATLAIGIGTRAAAKLEKTWGAAGVIATDIPNAMAKAMAKIHSTRNEAGEMK